MKRVNDNEEYNYYELLAVDRNATNEEIDFKFNEIINFLNPGNHPEKNYSEGEYEEAISRMEIVALAYSTLIDPESRRRYDEKLFDQAKHETSPKDREVTLIPVTPRQSTRNRRSERNAYTYTTPTTSVSRPEGKTARPYTYQRPNKARKETFFESIKRQYKEVRSDEKRYPFSKRHKNIEQLYYETFADGVDNLPKEIIYYTAKGPVHVFLETFYQLSRLKYINKDQFTKYVIRNRRLIAAAAIIGVMATNGMSKSDDLPITSFNHPEDTTPKTSIETMIEEEPKVDEDAIVLPELPTEEPRIVMQRYYTIQSGDNLATIARNSNTSIEELKQINGYDTNTIYVGRKMSIPYIIQTEDLEYYVQNVNINDYSIEELARAYETDVETLCRLNPNGIAKYNNKYYALTESLYVPNFITKDELYQNRSTGNAQYF